MDKRKTHDRTPDYKHSEIASKFTVEWRKKGERLRTESGSAEIKRDEKTTIIIGTVSPVITKLVINIPKDLGEVGKFTIVPVESPEAKSNARLGGILEGAWMTDCDGEVKLEKTGSKFFITFFATSRTSGYIVEKGYFEFITEP